MPFAGRSCTRAVREPMPEGRTDLYEPVSAKPTRRHTCAAGCSSGRRRAALEEALLEAYENGDRERVSLLGGELAQLVAVGSA